MDNEERVASLYDEMYSKLHSFLVGTNHHINFSEYLNSDMDLFFNIHGGLYKVLSVTIQQNVLAFEIDFDGITNILWIRPDTPHMIFNLALALDELDYLLKIWENDKKR